MSVFKKECYFYTLKKKDVAKKARKAIPKTKTATTTSTTTSQTPSPSPSYIYIYV
jgi:hypothetical protein